ncbi:hypothetical protein C8R44DRAFT_725534 [Mycena epipterygia]|nr:hypothetical protein C8R44DRAFT_725534 [Mycena epipterygia]
MRTFNTSLFLFTALAFTHAAALPTNYRRQASASSTSSAPASSSSSSSFASLDFQCPPTDTDGVSLSGNTVDGDILTCSYDTSLGPRTCSYALEDRNQVIEQDGAQSNATASSCPPNADPSSGSSSVSVNATASYDVLSNYILRMAPMVNRGLYQQEKLSTCTVQRIINVTNSLSSALWSSTKNTMKPSPVKAGTKKCRAIQEEIGICQKVESVGRYVSGDVSRQNGDNARPPINFSGPPEVPAHGAGICSPPSINALVHDYQSQALSERFNSVSGHYRFCPRTPWSRLPSDGNVQSRLLTKAFTRAYVHIESGASVQVCHADPPRCANLFESGPARLNQLGIRNHERRRYRLENCHRKHGWRLAVIHLLECDCLPGQACHPKELSQTVEIEGLGSEGGLQRRPSGSLDVSVELIPADAMLSHMRLEVRSGFIQNGRFRTHQKNLPTLSVLGFIGPPATRRREKMERWQALPPVPILAYRGSVCSCFQAQTHRPRHPLSSATPSAPASTDSGPVLASFGGHCLSHSFPFPFPPLPLALTSQPLQLLWFPCLVPLSGQLSRQTDSRASLELTQGATEASDLRLLELLSAPTSSANASSADFLCPPKDDAGVSLSNSTVDGDILTCLYGSITCSYAENDGAQVIEQDSSVNQTAAPSSCPLNAIPASASASATSSASSPSDFLCPPKDDAGVSLSNSTVDGDILTCLYGSITCSYAENTAAPSSCPLNAIPASASASATSSASPSSASASSSVDFLCPTKDNDGNTVDGDIITCSCGSTTCSYAENDGNQVIDSSSGETAAPPSCPLTAIPSGGSSSSSSSSDSSTSSAIASLIALLEQLFGDGKDASMCGNNAKC